MNSIDFRRKVIQYFIGHAFCMAIFASTIQGPFSDIRTPYIIIGCTLFAIIMLNAIVLTPNDLRKRYKTTFQNQVLKKRILLFLFLSLLFTAH